MNKFVVVSSQRTGSTLLVSSLTSHPNILCAGEIFFMGAGNKYAIRHYLNASWKNRALYHLHRKKLVNNFLNAFYAQQEYSAVGFKYMYSQASRFPHRFPEVLSYLEERNISVIHNIRENFLRVHISRLAAKSRGIYHSQKNIPFEKIHVPPKSLLRELTLIRDLDVEWASRLRSLPYLQVSYENLVANQENESASILYFLGVKKISPITSKLKKITPSNLHETILNYKEVYDALAGTEFEWCMHDQS